MSLNMRFETNQKANFYGRFVARTHIIWLIYCYSYKLFQLTLLRFLCEICLLDNKYITVSQSKIVAASLLVILKLRKRGLLKSEQVVCNQWVSHTITRNISVRFRNFKISFQTPALEYLTSYEEKAIRKIADLIHNTLCEVARVMNSQNSNTASNSQQAQNNKFSPIIEKYAENNFFGVSKTIVQFYRVHFPVN